MSRKTPIFLLWLACALRISTAASAAELVHYYKAIASLNFSTPSSQGWALLPGAPAGAHVVPGVDSPLYAWRVADSIATPEGYNAAYVSTLAGAAWETAGQQGWRIAARARYWLDLGGGPNLGLSAFVNNREYDLMLDLDAAGKLQATLFDETPVTYQLPTTAASATAYHDFELRSAPGTARVDFYFNGSLINPAGSWDGVLNLAHPTDTVQWGNSNRAGGATGVMDFHEIKVETGPFSLMAADFDGNSTVDGRDLAWWQAGFGRTGTASHAAGDADGDFDVDGGDFLVWQRDLGAGGTVIAPVAEPSSFICLASAGLVGMVRCLRRRRSQPAGASTLVNRLPPRVCGLRIAAALCLICWAEARGAELSVERTEGGATVSIDGEPFAGYLTRSGHQPVVWPIVGPSGEAMTRQYPMGEPQANERDDHPHHRSLWFNHGAVNGLDFWAEPKRDAPEAPVNLIEHREFAELKAGGEAARIASRNDWTSNGRKVCEDERTIGFRCDQHGRWIDFRVVLRASEGELTLGDTKEGLFGIRVPGSMKVDAGLGGRIVNSRGMTDEQAWGRAAEWVSYQGPVGGAPAGIAVFGMPDSFRHPCRWHVRTYGLFAANPIGKHDFPPGDPAQGAVTLKQGESLAFHYRVLFYQGERSAEQLERLYRELAGRN